MATDATGTPSTNWLIPKFLTSADAPSGKGLNAIVDYLDTLLKNKFPGFSSAITGTPSSTTYLRGDGSWASISSGPGAPATTLPGSPTDGQQAILVDSTSAPTYSWLFQYSSTASKWLFIGGSPAFSFVAANESTTSGTFVNFTTDQFITVPRAGTYIITAGMQSETFDASGFTTLGYKVGASAAVQLVLGHTVTLLPSVGTRSFTASAGDQVHLQLSTRNTGGTAAVSNRWMEITPVTVT